MKKNIAKHSKLLLLMGVLASIFTLTGFAADAVAEVPKTYGFISLIPPILTITLAFITKQTIISMFAGIWLGATIINGWNPIDGLLKGFTGFIIPQVANSWNAGMLVIMVLLGGFIYMISACGATDAFEMWAKKRVNSSKKAQIFTWIAPFLFIFNQGCLLIGAIMRPITDKMKVPRVKLAYLTDALGAPLVSMSPISDNGVYIVGLITAQIAALGLTQDAWSLYFAMFAFNYYAVFTIIAALIVVCFGLNIGAMKKAEDYAAATGKVYGDHDKLIAEAPDSNLPADYRLSYANFLVPMLTFIITIFVCIFYTGKIWENGLIASFTNANIQISIAMAFLMGSIGAAIIALKTKLLNIGQVLDKWTQGGAMMVQVMIILVLAWSISAVTSEMQVGPYLSELVKGNMVAGFIPAIMFLIGVVISFATGSSWGVWALGLPIAMPMAVELGISLPLAIGAVISGGLFGDHCSPISDTTIQSSTGACCDHLEHVKTQLPYALIVGISSFVGYLSAGFINIYIGSVVAFVCMITALYGIKIILNKENTLKAS